MLDTDHQFDLGSRIDIKTLGPTQIENLARLGKVWGFLKYYDPVVTTGHVQWDYELFRILPKILAAKDKAAADDVLAKWIAKLGPVPDCHPCAHPETKDIQLRPDLAWIDDAQDIGKALSDRLRWIRRNRNKSGQFYVALSFPGGNPVFKHELPYTSIKFPDSGFQLLALYRFWNMIEYWYPYRNVVGENWDKVLKDFIPRLALAKSRKQYILQMMALIAKIHDTHANLWSALNERPPVGKCHLPVRIRFVGYQSVVTGYLGNSGPGSSPLRIGDVVTGLDGKAVSLLIGKWTPYYGASNQAALRREIATFMTRGSCGETTVSIRRNGQAMKLKTRRVPIPDDYWFGTNDLPGPAFRMLSPQVAYLKISAAKKSRMADYIKRAAGSRGLIIDMRGYPSSNGLMPGQHMIERTTPFSRFTVGDLATPGAFHWQPPQSLQPDQPHYSGKVVIIVDSLTQSYSEYTSMDLRAAGAIVVGSTTAGADGDLSHIPLPGGLSTAISGLGVFYPDKQPTQRIGIIPDVLVRPTVAGIRAGRDQLLEAAIRQIVGPDVPLDQIEHMYRNRPDGQSAK